jgi:hypothetical protein
MRDETSEGEGRRLLVFNCHEAWVYQLGVLGYGLDVIIGLSGRYNAGWDEQMRPFPAAMLKRNVDAKEAIA